MKKLLSILAATTLTVSASSAVLACKDDTVKENNSGGESTNVLKAALTLKDETLNKISSKSFKNTIIVTLNKELSADQKLTVSKSKTSLLEIGEIIQDSDNKLKYSFDVTFDDSKGTIYYNSFENLIGEKKKESISVNLDQKSIGSIEIENGMYSINLTDVQELISGFLNPELLKPLLSGFLGEDGAENIATALSSIFSVTKDTSLTTAEEYYEVFVSNNIANLMDILSGVLPKLGSLLPISEGILSIIPYIVLYATGFDLMNETVNSNDGLFTPKNLTDDSFTIEVKELSSTLIKTIIDKINEFTLSAIGDDAYQLNVSEEDIISITESIFIEGGIKIELN